MPSLRKGRERKSRTQVKDPLQGRDKRGSRLGGLDKELRYSRKACIGLSSFSELRMLFYAQKGPGSEL